MADFSSLSNELVDDIISLLPKKDVLAIVLVSKRFYTLSEPFIYRSISFPPAQSHRILYLLRSLLNRPLLSLHINHFSFHSWTNVSAPLPILNPKELTTLHRSPGTITTFMLPGLSDPIRFIQTGNVDRTVAYILSQSQNLKSIHLTFDVPRAVGTDLYTNRDFVAKRSYHTRKLFRHFQKPIAAGELFPKLEEVEFDAAGETPENSALSWSQAQGVFYLCGLKKLKILRLEEIAITWHQPGPAGGIIARKPRAQMLTELILVKTPNFHLKEILSVCPNLKTLRYEYVGDDHVIEGNDESVFECEMIGEALKQVSSTLEHLTLDAQINSSSASELWNESPWGVRGRVGDLSLLIKLQNIEVPIGLLLGIGPDEVQIADVLPKSIRNIHFRKDLPYLPFLSDHDESSKIFFDSSPQYLECKRDCAPDLKVISIGLRHHDQYKFRKEINLLEEACRKQGVEFYFSSSI